MDHEKLCSQILKMDPKIRFASVYNEWAEQIAGGMQEGLDGRLPENMTHETVNLAMLRWESRKKMYDWVGKAKYAMTEYERVKRFTFYLNDNYLLLVSTELDADHVTMISKIQKLLKPSPGYSKLSYLQSNQIDEINF